MVTFFFNPTVTNFENPKYQNDYTIRKFVNDYTYNFF